MKTAQQIIDAASTMRDRWPAISAGERLARRRRDRLAEKRITRAETMAALEASVRFSSATASSQVKVEANYD